MIEKIIEISNVGHFVDYRFQGSKEWNGQFKRVNVIYAPNGSGKTTLSTILKSLALSNPELMKFKKTFGSEKPSKVILKETDNSELIKFSNETWSANNLKIEVFDINYIEEYLFAGSYFRKANKVNLFKLLLDERGNVLKKKMKKLFADRARLTYSLNRGLKFQNELSEQTQRELNTCLSNIKLLLEEYHDYSHPIFQQHIEIVNKYLEKFTTYIRMSEFTYSQSSNQYEIFRIFPVFEVYGEKIIFSGPDPAKKLGNARYALSEGDKSTIALCFFLARLEIQSVTNKIIVFDDPLSSFDYSRRTATIFQLSKIANSAVQFILLTHDLTFANDFTDKCSFLDCLNLKIESDGETSYLCHHDLAAEYLTSTQKDIEVIKSYLEKSASTESDRREVVRCIRPVLEGVFKTKYFDLIEKNKWLGDIIDIIKKSENSRLKRLTPFIDDIIELNDYTKNYHHASASNKEQNINPSELQRYITLLMKTIDRI